ncbi:YbaB/EbfC family nucleoid-associated protein [Microbispora sp. NPDC046933]|uniref:YbaB/EbfC family nucleoid-associated protein n=1 Tax=Microbispora sp. NPDC046933 TaxID=3155618 RepID=UPI00340F9864
MTTPSPDGDAELLERVLMEGRATMRRLQEARAMVHDVTGRAESADRTVKAVADGRGEIVELHFDPRVMRLGREVLGRQVTAVLREAQRDAEARTRAIMDAALAETADVPAPLDERFVRDRVERIARDLL